MTIVWNKDNIEKGAISVLLFEKEVEILRQKEEALKILANFALTIFKDGNSGRGKLSRDTEEELDKIRSKYFTLIHDINKNIKLHKELTGLSEDITAKMKAWLNQENQKTVDMFEYIDCNFSMKELDLKK